MGIDLYIEFDQSLDAIGIMKAAFGPGLSDENSDLSELLEMRSKFHESASLAVASEERLQRIFPDRVITKEVARVLRQEAADAADAAWNTLLDRWGGNYNIIGWREGDNPTLSPPISRDVMQFVWDVAQSYDPDDGPYAFLDMDKGGMRKFCERWFKRVFPNYPYDKVVRIYIA